MLGAVQSQGKPLPAQQGVLKLRGPKGASPLHSQVEQSPLGGHNTMGSGLGDINSS